MGPGSEIGLLGGQSVLSMSQTKGNQVWISLEGLMLKLKLQFFGHLMWWADKLDKILKDWVQEKKGTTEDAMVGWIAPPTQWTWVWANSGRQWRTGKPGMLQSTGWVSEWTTTVPNKPFSGQDARMDICDNNKKIKPGFHSPSLGPEGRAVLYNLPWFREAWRATVRGVAKSWTQLSDWTELNWTGSASLHSYPLF